MNLVTKLKRMIGLHPLGVDHDQEAAQRRTLEQRQVEADRRLRLVQAEARVVRRR